jgi:hypothetical protein
MGIFDFLKKKESPFEDLYQIIDKQENAWQLDPAIESDLLSWDGEQKTLLLIDILEKVNTIKEKDKEWSQRRSTYNLLSSLFSIRKIQFGNHVIQLLRIILERTNDAIENRGEPIYAFSYLYVVKPVLSNILRFYKLKTSDEKDLLGQVKIKLEIFSQHNPQKEILKIIQKIDGILFEESDSTEVAVKPTYFTGNDKFKNEGNAIIDSLDENQKKYCFQIISLAQKASGSKPAKKYLQESNTLIEALGNEAFKKFSQNLFQIVIELKETLTTHTGNFNGQTYVYGSVDFLDSLNMDVLKGLVWMNSKFYDNKTILTTSKLAERCFKKIPGKGPAAAGLGNACLYTLYASKGLDGIAQLSKLKLKIKQNATIDLIEKYIREAAGELGISSTEVEDLAVDDFKLNEYKLEVFFDEVKAVLELTGIGKSTIRWYKEDGKEQKTLPQSVKEKYADKLRKLKDKQKQIDQTTSVQKERFDRMMRLNRIISLEYFKEKYINHGLLSFVVNKVIFKFSNEKESIVAILLNNDWLDIDGKKVNVYSYANVTLWHPATSSTEEVKQWRQFLMDAEIQQPFKQAYREIYLLTEAEINTRTYSNRMASHILKQHQYVTLAKGRNWKAKLIGAWDGGDLDTAELRLPDFNIKVEYWVHALNTNDQWNDIGIWNYVTTDQVRFINAETNELVDLVNVPVIAFSEAMRDIDLFVGVASVGNDPAWRDSGQLPMQREYWESYAFGDLSEIAKNRKEILLNLIPRLKIAAVAHVSDKFLIVKGKLRTYKIHIGSTNILMEPNDQYLCIVPDRTKRNEAENVFLPFEGDSGLSVIISKAFLLAADNKITDTTIISQINRR